MWAKILTLFVFSAAARSEQEIPSQAFASAESTPKIERYVSEGVKSLGSKLVYGHEDEFNEVFNDMEKPKNLKSPYGPQPQVKNLPAVDVKCLMSDDQHCTREMGQMKSVLIQAVKEDCAKCSRDQKIAAGKVIASMMAHNPAAWKLFLSMHLGLRKAERILG